MPGSRHPSFRCLSPLAWRHGFMTTIFIVTVLIATLIAMQARAAGWNGAVFVVGAFAALLAAFLWPSRVVLLEDGLTFKRYGLTRFIPYSKIQKAELVQRLGAAPESGSSNQRTWPVYCAVRLHLVGVERPFDIGTGREKIDRPAGAGSTSLRAGMFGFFGAFDRNGWELKNALDERRRAVSERPEPSPAAAELMRGEKTAAEWLAFIDSSRARAGEAYRGNEGAREALWRVLEDHAAPREARAAAAFALRSHLDDESRHRMRVVVQECESPKLRVALETALDEDPGEERLVHALEQASFPREKT